MDKFVTNVQVEEDAEFQVWLDAQEVADIRAMEAEQAQALRRVRLAAMQEEFAANGIHVEI